MQKTWWVVNGERSDVASSYSGARHSWPANCTAVCCITALHCYHCHHRSAVQCDSNVKWSGLCYNWASCVHMYDCRAFIIEYQELCRAVLSWLQGISWVHQGGRLSWGAGGIWAVTCFDLNSHHQTFSQVITTSCTDPPPVGTQELVRGWAPGTAEHFSVTVTCFTPTGLSH